MGEYHQITISEWMEMKDQLRRELNNVRQSYIRVGYVLRRMEETKAYEAEGYKSVSEFAEKEHGLKPSTTSRWMSINKEYSLGGYSMQLDPKYIDMNASQLTEMLGLPMEDRELVSAGTKREDIRELKRLQKMTEDQGDFEKIVRSFFMENPGLLEELEELKEEPERYSENAWIELIAPSGNRAYRKNGSMIFLYEDKIKFKVAGHSPETLQWSEFFEVADGIILEKREKEEPECPAEDEDSEETAGAGIEEDSRTEGPDGQRMDDRRGDEELEEVKDESEDDGEERDDSEAAEDVCETGDPEGGEDASGDDTGDLQEEDPADEEQDPEPEGSMNPPAAAVNSEEAEEAEEQEDVSEEIAPAQLSGKDEEIPSESTPRKGPENIVDESGNPSPERIPYNEFWGLINKASKLCDDLKGWVSEEYAWDEAIALIDEDLRPLLIRLQLEDAKK